MTEKAKGSRIRGFKGSSGLLGIFFQNIKAKGPRSQGFGKERVQGAKDLEKKGFKDSRIRGVERRKAEDRIQKSEVRSQEAGEG